MKTRSYAILGTGGLGGFYGARLQRAGHNVHFLMRSDADYVREHGLNIQSIDGDFELPEVQVWTDTAAMPACDVIAVCLKATQNHLLPEMIAPLLHKHSVILVLQNGLGLEEDLQQRFSEHTVIGGCCFLCSVKEARGVIHHLDYGGISIAGYLAGYQHAGVTPAMENIQQDFAAADIDITFEPDLLTARWKKLAWNIPYNGLSVVLNTSTKTLMEQPETAALVKDLMAEVQQGAAACDRFIDDTFLDKMLSYTAKMVPYSPSMKVDYEQGRPLEIEAIFARPLAMAADRGCTMPAVSMLYRQLCFLNPQ